ncbi:nicotinamide-nucleotide adenylyltransferase [Candidatus Peregrinibacteria bacterium]|nr:nicotinamide-nucleotide adenylyltransferase [Candidatus Peregrinibacteria bacterium]
MSSNILFIGRFQPFHRGHLWVIQQIMEQQSKMLIGIGSAQYKGTQDNPFSVKDRTRMIEAALEEAGIAKNTYRIVPIPDIHDDAAWPAHVRKLVAQEFDAVWTGRPLVKKLFQQYDRVKIVNLIRWKGISATQVRRKMQANDETWRELVPQAVAGIIGSLQSPKSAP